MHRRDAIVVYYQSTVDIPKLDVAGSTPVSRSTSFNKVSFYGYPLQTNLQSKP